MIRPEYLKTLFAPKKPGKNQPPPDWSRPFAILTAHNPGGKKVDPETNAGADKELRRSLSRKSLPKHRITGVSEDWSHEEKGFAVWGLNHKTASEIGHEFRQDAYFWVEHGNVHVHSCHTQEKQKVGTWESRLREQPNRFAIQIYVIELKPAVLRNHAFQQQNPGCRKNPGLGCLYVGSSHDVGKRIRIHRFGPGPGDNPLVHGSRIVRDYFLRRRKDLEPSDVYETSGHATLAETLEAEFLRDEGYRVYSN
jgi:hypothetical protein